MKENISAKKVTKKKMFFNKSVIFNRHENLLRMYITLALRADQSFSYYLAREA